MACIKETSTMAFIAGVFTMALITEIFPMAFIMEICTMAFITEIFPMAFITEIFTIAFITEIFTMAFITEIWSGMLRRPKRCGTRYLTCQDPLGPLQSTSGWGKMHPTNPARLPSSTQPGAPVYTSLHLHPGRGYTKNPGLPKTQVQSKVPCSIRDAVYPGPGIASGTRVYTGPGCDPRVYPSLATPRTNYNKVSVLKSIPRSVPGASGPAVGPPTVRTPPKIRARI